MVATFTWGSVGSAYNLLTTEMNSLASGSGTALGPEIDNTSNAYQMGRLHLHIASNSLALVAGSYCKVFFLSSNAGSTYPNYTSGASYVLAESNYLVGTIALFPATVSARRWTSGWKACSSRPASSRRCWSMSAAALAHGRRPATRWTSIRRHRSTDPCSTLANRRGRLLGSFRGWAGAIRRCAAIRASTNSIRSISCYKATGASITRR